MGTHPPGMKATSNSSRTAPLSGSWSAKVAEVPITVILCTATPMPNLSIAAPKNESGRLNCRVTEVIGKV